MGGELAKYAWHANLKPTTKLPEHCKKSHQFRPLKGRRPYESRAFEVKKRKFIQNAIVSPIEENVKISIKYILCLTVMKYM